MKVVYENVVNGQTYLGEAMTEQGAKVLLERKLEEVEPGVSSLPHTLHVTEADWHGEAYFLTYVSVDLD